MFFMGKVIGNLNRKAIAQSRYQHGKKGNFVGAVVINRKARKAEKKNDDQFIGIGRKPVYDFI